MSYEPLKLNPDYEISTLYPHPIREKGDDVYVEEHYIDELKTFFVDIRKHFKSKAFIVADQFLPNPEEISTIKFKNKNTCDYRIENLEWVPKAKSKQPTKAEYLDKLPDNAIKIEAFGKYKYNDYYFDPESKQVIQTNSSKSKSKIKVIKPSDSNGREIIVIKDSEDKRRTVGYKDLVKHYENLNVEEDITIESED
jgi:hypothetical protein